MSKKNVILDKYIATLVLYALGDTIAFKNGDWLFGYGKKVISLDVVNEMLYEFIDLGGINGINLENWKISINTLLHTATAYGMIDYFNDGKKKSIVDYVEHKYEEAYIKIFEDFNKNIKRGVKLHLRNIMDAVTKGKELICDPCMNFNEYDRDNTSAIRTLCVGLLFNGNNKRLELIDNAIKISKITTCSPIGFLGGLTSALFAAFAIEKIEITKWPFELIKILNDKELVTEHITNDNLKNEYDSYMSYWEKYIELRFSGDTVIKTKVNTNVIFRSKFYYDNFTSEETSYTIGMSGISCVIMAYDCLLDAGNKWEKLIIYSALDYGDNYSVASIACGLYGAYYGWGDIPPQNLKYLEYKNEIFEVAKSLYKLANK